MPFGSFVQVTSVSLAKRLPPANRRMLRRERETFFLGVAMTSNSPEGYGYRSNFEIPQDRKCNGPSQVGACTTALVEVCPTLGADPFAVLGTERLKRDLQLNLLAERDQVQPVDHVEQAARQFRPRLVTSPLALAQIFADGRGPPVLPVVGMFVAAICGPSSPRGRGGLR